MEIEKKYFVKRLPEHLESFPKKYLSQAYISTSPVIRVREVQDAEGRCFILTVKGHGQVVREEYELTITEDEYQRLLVKCEGIVLSKERFLIPLQEEGLIAELDRYHGPYEGLYTVEVEFQDVSQMNNFTPPDWFGEDISEDYRYKNSYMCTQGIE